MVKRNAADRGAAGVGQLDHRHLNRPGFFRLIGEERVIHVDHPTGISANAKPQIIATVEAMILLSPHSTSATAQAVSTSGAIASAAFTERLSSTEESEVPIKLAIPKLS